jgi:hypothetical protein
VVRAACRGRPERKSKRLAVPLAPLHEQKADGDNDDKQRDYGRPIKIHKLEGSSYVF